MEWFGGLKKVKKWNGQNGWGKRGVKDIVQGFGKLKKMAEKSGMKWNGLED